jgi:hypothetical protein
MPRATGSVHDPRLRLWVDAAEPAITIAHAFVKMTRSMAEFSRLIDGADDIEWASGPRRERHRPERARRLRSSVPISM